MAIPIAGGFAGVKDSSFTAVVGTNQAKVAEVTFIETPSDATLEKFNKKHPGEEYPGYIKWEFDVTTEGSDNRKIWHNTPLYRDDLGMLKSVLLALGFTVEEIEDENFSLDLEDPRVMGGAVTIKSRADKSDDTQTRVLGIYPPEEDNNLPG